jgi:FtsP/CotA-like multicopper oxidase with cupredoxin domain
MKGKLMKQWLVILLTFLMSIGLAVSASAALITVGMHAEEVTASMPDGGPTITMWGFRDATDATNPGAWRIPVINATAGDDLTINLTNDLPDDTSSTLKKPVSIMIPGQVASESFAMRPTWTDGSVGPRGVDATKRVRSLTHEASPAGGTDFYSWSALKPGTYLIQSASHMAVQAQMGLYGVLVVASATPGQAYDDAATAYDSEVVLVLSEIDEELHAAVAADDYGPGKTVTSTMLYEPTYYLINGSPDSSTATPVSAGSFGDTVLVRFVNAGIKDRVPVLNNGPYMKIVAEDGNLLPYPLEQYSAHLAPGKTKDAILTGLTEPTVTLYDGRKALSNNNGATPGGMLVTLSQAGPVTLLAANGGESIVSGSSYQLSWGAPASATQYKLRYSLNGGTTWVPIDLAVGNVNSYVWSVPTVPFVKSNVLIKVQAYGAGGGWVGADVSDAPFSIVLPPTVLTSPNGDEVLAGGAVHNITWTTRDQAASFKLTFTQNDGQSWQPIDLAVGDVTSYAWSVPNPGTAKTKCLVRIRAYNGSGVLIDEDVSNWYFTINPTP